MSRDYGNAIVEERITGFQSPASEFAAKSLSIDERYSLGDPGTLVLTLATNAELFGFRAGDNLIINLGKKPRHNDLVLIDYHGEEGVFRYEFRDGKPKLFPPKFSAEELNDVLSGVIVALIRDFD